MRPINPTVADIIAFNAWPDEQRRIAAAGVSFSDFVEEAREEARIAGFDAGMEEGRKFPETITGRLHEVADELLLFRDRITASKHEHSVLGAALDKLQRILDVMSSRNT